MITAGLANVRHGFIGAGVDCFAAPTLFRLNGQGDDNFRIADNP